MTSLKGKWKEGNRADRAGLLPSERPVYKVSHWLSLGPWLSDFTPFPDKNGSLGLSRLYEQHGLYRAPAFLLGVWTLVCAKQSYVTSCQWKLLVPSL